AREACARAALPALQLSEGDRTLIRSHPPSSDAPPADRRTLDRRNRYARTALRPRLGVRSKWRCRPKPGAVRSRLSVRHDSRSARRHWYISDLREAPEPRWRKPTAPKLSGRWL